MSSRWHGDISRRTEIALIAAITLLAFGLRAFGHWYAPYGWRDDELSNALVLSQHVLDGEVQLYYDDASGHEGLYHWLQAGTMALFGPGVWGIRGVSIILGTLAVPLLYMLTRRLFDWPLALLTAFALAVSFWALMYSRAGQRHVAVTVTTLLAFVTIWRGVQQTQHDTRWLPFAVSGFWMGIGFYTYFASRGIPLIVIAWLAYLLIWQRDEFKHVWRGVLATLAVALLLGIPLFVTLQQQPEAEARVAELALPVYDAQSGDYSTLAEYVLTTASMFTHDGDSEELYNVAHRPVFGLPGSILFWVGIALALVKSFGPARDGRYAFLLLWLGAGLAPGVLSIPAASLGHTIVAQPVAMIFPALALGAAGQWLASQPDAGLKRGAAGAILAAALVYLGVESVRGVYDYFVIWPQQDFNRVLHHSDLHAAAPYLNGGADRDLVVGSFLAERWDQQAVNVDLHAAGWRIRAFNPDSVYILLPEGGKAVIPTYLHSTWGMQYLTPLAEETGVLSLFDVPSVKHYQNAAQITVFTNGLALLEVQVLDADNATPTLDLLTVWEVNSALTLPEFPLLSKPPAPGEDDTLRLAIFVQLLDQNNQLVAGDDKLGVDPYTLLPGDVFVQQHNISLENVQPGTYQIILGLYDPATGARILVRETGADYFLTGEWTHS